MYKYMNLFRCCVTVDSFTNYIKLYRFISHCIYSAPHWIRSWMNWKSSGQCRSKNSSDHRCTQESCRCSALSSLQLDRKQPKIKSKEKIREIKIQEDFRKDKWKAIRIARIAPFWRCLRSLLPVMSIMSANIWQGQLLAAEQLQEMHFHLGKLAKKKIWLTTSVCLCVCLGFVIFSTKWPISWVEFLGLFGESSTMRQYETTSLKKHIYVATIINP